MECIDKGIKSFGKLLKRKIFRLYFGFVSLEFVFYIYNVFVIYSVLLLQNQKVFYFLDQICFFINFYMCMVVIYFLVSKKYKGIDGFSIKEVIYLKLEKD